MGCPVPKVVNNGEGSALMKIGEGGSHRFIHCKGNTQTGDR